MLEAETLDGPSPYPPGFDLWSPDRRNEHFKEKADDYDRKRREDEEQEAERQTFNDYHREQVRIVRERMGLGDKPPARRTAPPMKARTRESFYPRSRFHRSLPSLRLIAPGMCLE
jgi:hypothetical protein